jgi:hypothetical protein
MDSKKYNYGARYRKNKFQTLNQPLTPCYQRRAKSLLSCRNLSWICNVLAKNVNYGTIPQSTVVDFEN